MEITGARDFTRDDWRSSRETAQVFWEGQLWHLVLTRDRKEVRYPRTFLVQPDRAVWAAAVVELCAIPNLTLSPVFLPDRKNSSTTIDGVSQSDLVNDVRLSKSLSQAAFPVSGSPFSLNLYSKSHTITQSSQHRQLCNCWT